MFSYLNFTFETFFFLYHSSFLYVFSLLYFLNLILSFFILFSIYLWKVCAFLLLIISVVLCITGNRAAEAERGSDSSRSRDEWDILLHILFYPILFYNKWRRSCFVFDETFPKLKELFPGIKLHSIHFISLSRLSIYTLIKSQSFVTGKE